jgi:hypothetical protein
VSAQLFTNWLVYTGARLCDKRCAEDDTSLAFCSQAIFACAAFFACETVPRGFNSQVEMAQNIAPNCRGLFYRTALQKPITSSGVHPRPANLEHGRISDVERKTRSLLQIANVSISEAITITTKNSLATLAATRFYRTCEQWNLS